MIPIVQSQKKKKQKTHFCKNSMRLRVINFETFFCGFFYESAFRKANFGIDLKIIITETDNHLRPREESVNKQVGLFIKL